SSRINPVLRTPPRLRKRRPAVDPSEILHSPQSGIGCGRNKLSISILCPLCPTMAHQQESYASCPAHNPPSARSSRSSFELSTSAYIPSSTRRRDLSPLGGRT